ncbi:hypothetical protein A3I56_03215 [Candidatus Roizmanbacteria bacterium RIFCSPLOWO2_02_FULL_43_10]|uniref:Nucleotidyl transferase AbiEii/AbiGii toxin family protein n=3 Tax=Candidatus Roizmaniibacteriota TaxID=1752723 RepID=A0A1F7JWA4_9BACT|nr:MAG: hypothetical protein A3D08_00240 [Candidatus Roizmanbacteria bacterium RIFCSPHIGHO2_02_FULL_43_11]OGK37946.1 MAG: hypothetical protein A3F32_02175 [Candidatus Roizmanbacteria bacterium RIFCSPHIGHO2_12_FULL_42_10]OGK59854.1 MAG: hypothetical protein A3I56_03215 [Candidatus Roizmanbacteria bacterium RIFCSPLOWO2_02_FULL_43_10]
MNQAILKLHHEILDKDRKKILQDLLPFFSDFILAGGTGLALQIKHRKSFDFDLFSHHEIQMQFAQKVKKALDIHQVSENSTDELTVFTERDIKISFLYYPFGEKFIVNQSEGIRLYSPESIAVQKAYTIGRRGAYRDYFDIYTLLSNNIITLNDLLKKAQNIYGSLFNDRLFLEQLTYFDDFHNFDIIPVSEDNTLPKPSDVQRYLEEIVKGYIS